jgi:glutaredoxin
MNIRWLNHFFLIFRKCKLSAGLLLCLVVLFPASSLATTLYKWVDADGKISYQDRPPPKNAKILEEREINAPETTAPILDGVPVVIYTLDNCVRCDEVITWMTARGVPIEQRPLQEDREAQRQILELSNGLSAPTLFIDDKFVTDTSEASMLTALRDAEYNLVLPEPDTTSPSDAVSEETATADGEDFFSAESDIDQEAIENSTEQTPDFGVEE